ncbi:hypothetical protein YTPLAS18_24350 [Nitrospira sp.]|nr:hypothetical protein YTPLAS18_24350 [Nitrospira sp.]
MTERTSVRRGKINWWIVVFVAVIAGSVAVAILMGARASAKPTWRQALVSASGIACLLGMGGTLVGSAFLALECRRAAHRRNGEPASVLVTFVLIGTAVMALELILRMATVQRPWEQEIGSRLLLPRGWDRVVATYSTMLDRFDTTPNYFVEDSLLGWKIGPNRSGSGGRWLSGPEGARTPSEGYSYNQTTTSCRVVLLGDSYTFGWEEWFEQTMGFYLQERMGPACQVLNIAVPGYSLAQMLLAAQRDVPALKPSVVVLSFTDGAPERGLGVYCFLTMRDWDCPWAAPRFVLKEGRLELVNVPLPSPRAIFNHEAIDELPFIRYDRGYRSSQWEHPGWGPLYSSYLFRMAATEFPSYDDPLIGVSEPAIREINEAIMRAFVAHMDKMKIPFIIFYQPQKDEYGPDRRVPYSPEFLRRLNLDFVDGTTCLDALSSDQRFRTGGTHYSDLGEAALAECLVPQIERRFGKSLGDMVTMGERRHPFSSFMV